MWPEEIEWTILQFNRFIPKPAKTCIDIGSESLEYRTKLQPWNQKFYDYLGSRNIKVYTMDLDKKNKPDYIQDISKPIKNILKFDIILATHLLEHVPILKLEKVVKNIENLVKTNGFLLITVPHTYPYHARPIDNGWRPVPKELASIFKGKIIAKELVKAEHNSPKYKNKPMNEASCVLLKY